MIICVLICLIVGYMFGNISTAYIVGKLNHIDIRSYGSGNAGTTNAMRTLGKEAGIITYIGDVIKTVIPVLLMALIFQDTMDFHVAALITGFGVVLGHNYPFWLGFNGGKGIAVTSAVILLYSIKTIPLYILVFAIIVFFTGYVSVGSLAISTMFLLQIALFSIGEEHYIIQLIMAILFCVSAFYKHKANIRRLMNGTENKFKTRKQN